MDTQVRLGKVSQGKIRLDKVSQDSIPYSAIIDYLNSKLGSKYKSSVGKTKAFIKARFNEGFALEDFTIVIDKKVFNPCVTIAETYDEYLKINLMGLLACKCKRCHYKQGRDC